MPKKITANLFSILTILAVVLLAFTVIVTGQYTMKWDMLNQFFPCRHFISECFHNHIFPLWCPYINMGYPFFADPQSGVFYPITWLFTLTVGYNAYTIGIEYVLHVLIAGIAFYFLLRSFNLNIYSSTAFAIVYCLSGVNISNAQHLSWIITMAWMPLILLNFKNVFENNRWQNAITLALFLSLGLTGGYPGFFIILLYFMVAYTIGQFAIAAKAKKYSLVSRWIILFTLALGVFLVLSSGYLYSFVNSLPYIARGKAVSLEDANNVALSPQALISFFFPFATAASSYNLNTDISMANIYCGILALPLVIIALVKKQLHYFHLALMLFAVVCFMAALGKYFVLRAMLYKYAPGLNMLRHAAIFRVFAVIGVIFVAATGFDRLLAAVTNGEKSRKIKAVIAGYAGMLVIVLLALIVKNGFGFYVLPFNYNRVAAFNLNQNYQAHILSQLWIQLPIIIAFCIVWFAKRISPSFKPGILSSLIIIEMLAAAWFNLPATVVSDVNPVILQHKLDNLSVAGYPVPAAKPIGDMTHLSDGSTLPIWNNISFFKKIPANDGFNSFYLQTVDDLFYSPWFAYYMEKPEAFLKNDKDSLVFAKFEPNAIDVRCHTTFADTLFLQQNFYPGWKGFVDDKLVALQHVYCDMTIPLTPGLHTVSFRYEQPTAKWMLVFSMFAMLCTIVGLVIGSNYKNDA